MRRGQELRMTAVCVVTPEQEKQTWEGIRRILLPYYKRMADEAVKRAQPSPNDATSNDKT